MFEVTLPTSASGSSTGEEMERATDERTRLTREALYEIVWAEPMHTLAPRYGISDVALKKHCKRMRVPTPWRGYWAKKAAGRTLKRTPLPKLPASVPTSTMTVTFGRAVKPPANEVAEATGAVADQARFEKLIENQLVVPELLTKPHPLVAASIQLIRKANADGQHRLIPSGPKCLTVSVSLGAADRAMLVYDTLLKALDQRGYAVDILVKEHGAETRVRIGEEYVGVGIDERIDRVERPQDPKSKQLWHFKEYDYVPSGRLSLRIQQTYLKARRTWSDGAKQRVEACLNDFIVGLVAAAEELKQQRLEREARHREYLSEQERERQVQERRQREEARIRALNADLVAWRKSQAIRQYAAAMRAAAAAANLLEEDSDLSKWLRWVESYADRLDPIGSEPTVPRDPAPPSRYRYGYGGNAPTNEPSILW